MEYECSRCLGRGRIAAFSHVLGGVCLKCHGTGRTKAKPAAQAAMFFVFGEARQSGKRIHLYNIRARHSAAAVAKARDTFSNASAAFRDEFTMANAVAIAADELTGLRGWACRACGVPNYRTSADSQCSACGAAIEPDQWNDALITSHCEDASSPGQPPPRPR